MTSHTPAHINISSVNTTHILHINVAGTSTDYISMNSIGTQYHILLHRKYAMITVI